MKLFASVRKTLHLWNWQYGNCHTNNPQVLTPARRHRFSGAVQFVLWPAGHRAPNGYIYEQDYWADYHECWWANFRPKILSKKSDGLNEGDWIRLVKAELIRIQEITPEQLAAENGKQHEWMQQWAEAMHDKGNSYYEDDYTPEEAVAEELSYG